MYNNQKWILQNYNISLPNKLVQVSKIIAARVSAIAKFKNKGGDTSLFLKRKGSNL